MRGKSKLLILLLIFSLMLTACSNENNVSKTEEEDIEVSDDESKKDTEEGDSQIVYGSILESHGTFNPMLSYMGLDGTIDNIVYPGLLQIGEDGNVEPYLAEEYTISDDQKELSFKLREDAKWHDGKPVTTEDVEYTILTMANPDFSGGGYSLVENIEGAEEFNEGKADKIKGIEIKDDYNITLNLDEVYGPILNKLGIKGIVPKHIWEDVPIDKWDEETEMLNYPLGCGPYKVSNYEIGQYVELEAFDDFFGGKPKTDKIIFKFINKDSIEAEFQSENIDVAPIKDLKKAEIESLESQGLEIIKYPDNMYQYVAMNLRMPIFQDKNLRQALNYCLDRELVLEKIVEGRGQLIDSPFIPSGWANPDPSELNPYKYDPEKAVELLEESGWTELDENGIRMNDKGEKLSFQLRCSNDSKMREEAVLFLKESAKNVGIDLDVSIEEDAKMAEDCIFNHNFEMYALNCYFGSHPDPYGWWHSDRASDEKGVGSFNFGAYKSDLVDENIEKGNGTFDQEEAKEYYLEVAKQINEDAPMIFLYVQDREMAYIPNLKGFNPSTFNEIYNIYNWEIQ